MAFGTLLAATGIETLATRQVFRALTRGGVYIDLTVRALQYPVTTVEDRFFFIAAFATAFYSATLLTMLNKWRDVLGVQPSSAVLHLAYTALVLSAVSLVLLTNARGVCAQPPQRELVPRVNVGTAVPLNETGRLASSFPFACPVGTGYVLDERRRDRRFMGCAPLGQQACSQAGSLEIEGSCAAGEACCFWGDTFRGCALSLRQCCYSQICPPGYTCCGNKYNWRCCPLPSGELVSNATLEALSCSAPGSDVPCLPAAGAFECPQTVDPLRCNAFEAPVDCAEAPPVHCQTADHCRYGNSTLLYNRLNRTLGISTDYYTPSLDAPETCCPNNGELCFSLNRNLIGCADPTRNETCCGARICGAGQQCCEYRLPSLVAPSDFDASEQLTYIVETRCCPDSIPCCAHDYDDADLSITSALVIGAEYPRAQDTFCGLARNVSGVVRECSIVGTAAPQYTFLYELLKGS
jgi:hypothetical protein